MRNEYRSTGHQLPPGDNEFAESLIVDYEFNEGVCKADQRLTDAAITSILREPAAAPYRYQRHA